MCSRAHFNVALSMLICARKHTSPPRHISACSNVLQCFDAFSNEVMEKFGFTVGTFSLCLYYNRERNAACVRHGDDFILCGIEEGLVWMQGLMRLWFETEVRAVLGPDE